MPDLKRSARITVPIANQRDWVPPYSPEAERGVLACCLLNPAECVGQCVAELRGGEAFYDLRNRTVYEAMVEMYEANEPLDNVTLFQHLKDAGTLDHVGGAMALSQLPEAAPSSFNLPAYLEIVKDKHTLRCVVEVCRRTVRRVQECDGDVGELLDAVEREVLAIRSMRRTDAGCDIGRLVEQSVAAMEDAQKRAGMLTGMSTGLLDWDRLTGGLHGGEVTVLAAYPGQGKTALAMNVAEHAALDASRPVAVFSLEMSGVSLVTRVLCSRGRVSLRNVRNGFMAERDWPRVAKAAGQLHKAAVFLDDASDVTVMELRAKARRLHQQHGLALVVVDYLQLVSGVGGSRKPENRQEEVSAVARGIKAMAMELHVPVLALSQLNDDGRLRESRSIGQDADNVAVIEPEKDKQDDPEVPVSLRFRKQRNGPIGTVHLVFLKAFTRFEAAAKISEDNQ